MPRIPFFIAVALALLPAQLAQAAAPRKTSARTVAVRQKIQTAYINLNSAAAGRDTYKVLAFLTDDWRGINDDGASITKKQLARRMRQALPGINGMAIRTTLVSVRVSGRTATVRTRTAADIVRPAAGSAQQAARVARRTDGNAFWVMTGSGWKMKRVRGPSFLLMVNSLPASSGRLVSTPRSVPPAVPAAPRRPQTVPPATPPVPVPPQRVPVPLPVIPVNPAVPPQSTPPTAPPDGGFTPPQTTF